MSSAEKKRRTPLSKAESIQEVGEFRGMHSLAEHWDETREASFEVRASRRRRVTIDPEFYERLESAAHTRGLSPETLVNVWLAEHLGKGPREQARVQRTDSSSAGR